MEEKKLDAFVAMLLEMFDKPVEIDVAKSTAFIAPMVPVRANGVAMPEDTPGVTCQTEYGRAYQYGIMMDLLPK